MTNLFVRPLAVTDGNQLASLVEGHLSALEPGLTLLERRFPAGEVLVDFLAQDARGRIVLCVLGSGSTSVMLVQAIDAYGWCCENGALLERLFPGVTLHVTAPPRLFLLAPRFSDGVRRTARARFASRPSRGCRSPRCRARPSGRQPTAGQPRGSRRRIRRGSAPRSW